jgi:hypothetical protein
MHTKVEREENLVFHAITIATDSDMIRRVVAHHLRMRATPPLASEYTDTIAIPPLATRHNRREDLPDFPLGDVQRVKIARVFAGGQLNFPKAEINSMPCRAAAAFCLIQSRWIPLGYSSPPRISPQAWG